MGPGVPVREPLQFVPRAGGLRRNLDGTFPRMPRPQYSPGHGASDAESGRLTSSWWDTRLGRGDPRPGRFGPGRDSQHANRENRATHGPQVQAVRGHQGLAEAASIVAGHGNTVGYELFPS